MSVDLDSKWNRERNREAPSAGRLLRRLRILLAVTLALTTFQHVTGTHAHAPAVEVATATLIVDAEPPCEPQGYHAGGLCHAVDGCPLFLPYSAVAVLASGTEEAPTMVDAFAASALLPPLRHPPKSPVKA